MPFQLQLLELLENPLLLNMSNSITERDGTRAFGFLPSLQSRIAARRACLKELIDAGRIAARFYTNAILSIKEGKSNRKGTKHSYSKQSTQLKADKGNPVKDSTLSK